MKSPRDIIIRPIFTEKSSSILQADGTSGISRRLQARIDSGDVEPRPKYTFQVAGSANKIEIRRAFEAIFEGQKVTSVRTMNVPGKIKRRGRTSGRTPSWKKAIIEVAGGPLDPMEGA